MVESAGMEKIVFLVLLLICLLLYGGHNQWNSGTLISYDQQKFITYAQTNASIHQVPQIRYSVQIDAGDRIYFAEHTSAVGWGYALPKVTANGPVAWKLNGKDELWLKDARGREFILTITNTHLKTPANP